MTARIDPTELVGKKYEHWTVISPADKDAGGHAHVIAQCSCGHQRPVRCSKLLNGQTKSCGHLHSATGRTPKAPERHGQKSRAGRTPEYRTWDGLIGRTENSRRANFQNYGGRGITVAQRWRESFAAFLEDMGRKPSPDHSIDRIDNDLGYEPGNCKWSTRLQQARNRRTNRIVEFGGRAMTLAEAIELSGCTLHRRTVGNRLGRGWDIDRALTQPPRAERRKAPVFTYPPPRQRLRTIAAYAGASA